MEGVEGYGWIGIPVDTAVLAAPDQAIVIVNRGARGINTENCCVGAELNFSLQGVCRLD